MLIMSLSLYSCLLVSIIVAIGALQSECGGRRCLKTVAVTTKEKRETETKLDPLLIFALIVATHPY